MISGMSFLGILSPTSISNEVRIRKPTVFTMELWVCCKMLAEAWLKMPSMLLAVGSVSIAHPGSSQAADPL